MIWAVQEPADNNNSHINNSVNNNGDHYSRVAQFPAVEYDWRELPQVSFLSRQRRVCRDKYVFVTTNTMGGTTTKIRLLSRQKYACCDKSFVAIKLCLHSFVDTKDVFCRDKHLFSHREVYVCRDKTFVATKK